MLHKIKNIENAKNENYSKTRKKENITIKQICKNYCEMGGNPTSLLAYLYNLE